MRETMTKEQIDEINKLLIDHGEALTTFYDEGMNIGKNCGFFDGCMAGFSVGALAMGVVTVFLYRMTHPRNKKKKKIERKKSPKQGLFSFFFFLERT